MTAQETSRFPRTARGQQTNIADIRRAASRCLLAGCLIALVNGSAHSAAAQTGGAEPAAGVAAPLSVVRWTANLPEAAGRTVELCFALYEDQAGGLALWSETQQVKVGADGRYSVLLGATSDEGLPPSLFQAGQARWIEAKMVSSTLDSVASEPPASPRRSVLAAVPYAFKAVDSETLGGRAAQDYVTREDLQSAVDAGVRGTVPPHPDTTLTGSGTAGFVPLWTGAATFGNSVIAESGTKIGIGTATPATTLDVDGTTTLEGNTSMPALGTATASGGVSSPVFSMSGSTFKAGGAAINQKFAWEVQSEGNNTSNPSSSLSLLYASGTNGVSNTGLSILPSGSLFTTANLTTAAVPATSNAADASPRMFLQGSAWNSSLLKAVQQNFAFSTVPTGNNTASPSANLVLQFSQGTAIPAATGLSFAPNGIVTFASGQTFPGTGTVTGVTAGTGIIVGGTAVAPIVAVDTAVVPTLNANNNFFGVSNTFTGPVSAASNVSSGAALTGTGTTGATGLTAISDTGYSVYARTAIPGHLGSQAAGIGYATILSTSGPGFSNTYSQVPDIVVSVDDGVGLRASIWADSSASFDGGYDASPVAMVATVDDGAAGVFANDSANYFALNVENLGGSGIFALGVDGDGIDSYSNDKKGSGVYGLAWAQSRGTAGVMGVQVDASYQSTNHNIFSGVWGDTGASSTGDSPAWAIGVIGTADDSQAGVFLNASDDWPTVYAHNYATGGVTGLFKTLMASSADGTCGFGGKGNLTCTGQVMTLNSTAGGTRTVETYAMQSPENWMEDFGSGKLQRGVAVVKLDPAFADTVTADASYHVFITPNGDSEGLYVINKTAAGFEVRESKGGTSSLSFDYRIVAKRRGYESQRLTDVTERFNAEQKAAIAPVADGPPHRAAHPGMTRPGHKPAILPHPARPEVTSAAEAQKKASFQP